MSRTPSETSRPRMIARLCDVEARLNTIDDKLDRLIEYLVQQVNERSQATKPRLESRWYRGTDGLERCKATGQLRSAVENPETPEQYASRIQARVAAVEAKVAADHAKKTEGLPPGFFRDPFGIIRDKKGRVAAVVERENQKRQDVEQQQSAEHAEWLELQGVTGREGA